MQATWELSVDGEMLPFEDVFVNHSIHYDITKTYPKLLIKMKSRVKVYACPPDDHSPVATLPDSADVDALATPDDASLPATSRAPGNATPSVK